MAFSKQDERFMRRALALAQHGLGKTSPNPIVGAVLARNGRVIGEGWHKRAGGPHAEVFALGQPGGLSLPTTDRARPPGAPSEAKGATLYVTMEPCSTFGKTPPCTEAIIAAGVKRVVVAATDPNPKHNGRGLKILRRAGIRVESGLLADEAIGMNESFNKWIMTGMPLVIAKAAMSLDGKIATRTGDSKWITSEAARREAHKLRASVDAIMVGANTVIRDDPQLTARHGVGGQQPVRVVVDARGRVPIGAKVFRDYHHNRTTQAGTDSASSLRVPVPPGTYKSSTIVITTNLSSARWRQRLVLLGIDVVIVKVNPRRGGATAPYQRPGRAGWLSPLPAAQGRVDLRVALTALGKRNVTSLLVEGGGELLGSFFDARLVDKIALFYAPIVIGGRGAITAVAGEGVVNVKKAVKLKDCQWQRIGKNEILVEARVAR